jgi:hypothetical protein
MRAMQAEDDGARVGRLDCGDGGGEAARARGWKLRRRRSKLTFTSSAVKGRPSCQRTPREGGTWR